MDNYLQILKLNNTFQYPIIQIPLGGRHTHMTHNMTYLRDSVLLTANDL